MKTLIEIKEWLKRPDHIRRILVEISNVTAVNGSTVGALYFSNGAYSTTSADTPSNTIYTPKVTGGVSFTESFSTGAELSVSYGDIELDNTDGSLDYLFNYIFTNRSITIYLGDPSWPKSDFKKLFVGTIVDVLARDRSTVNIVIADKLQKLNTSLSEAVIVQPTKNNQEELLPVCYGECFNVTPLIYQTTVGTSHTLTTISGGKTLTFSAAHNLFIGDTLIWTSSFNNIEANALYYIVTVPSTTTVTIKKGYYGTELTDLTNATGLTRVATANSGATYYIVHRGPIEDIVEVRDNGAGPIDFIPDLANGRFKLKRQAFGQITCSVQGDKTNNTYSNTIAATIKNILTTPAGNPLRFTSADIDNTQFSNFDSNLPANSFIGYYANSNQNLLDVCNQIAGSVRAKLAVTTGPQTDDSIVGLIKLVQLQSGSIAEHTITSSDIEQFSMNIDNKSEVRAATKLAYCKNWTVQQGNLATGLPPRTVSILGSEWLYQYVDDPVIKTRYNLTDEPNQEDTLLVTSSAAAAEATNRNNLWKTPRYIYNMTCYPHMFNVELGDCVSVTNSRFGLTNTLGTVVSVSRDWIGGRIEIGVLV